MKMNVVAYEGVVENGQVHLSPEVVLPEKATVYVVVPQAASESDDLEVIVLEPLSSRKTPPRVPTPRLVHREQAKDFIKEVYPESDDA
jgi:hypothetical protein